MAALDGVLPELIGAAGAGGADAEIVKSLRFDSGASAYLNRTPSSTGNRNTMTISLWYKNTVKTVGGHQPFLAAQFTSPAKDYFTKFTRLDDGRLNFSSRLGGSDTIKLLTTQVLRDAGAWYHLVLAIDTTQATASDRLKLYINGSEVTAFDTATYPSLNQNLDYLNENQLHFIGRYLDNSYEYFDGYLADFYFIDGSALEPTEFGAFDTNGVWQPSLYSGEYGTNGYHLFDFANESTIGHDSSGNENDWTANNFISSITKYSELGSFTATGSQVGGPLANAYDGTTGTNGGSTAGITFWGRSGGTATQSGLSISVSSNVVIFYNVNTSGGSISLNGSSKSAGVPSGGNTTIGTLTWSASDLSNTLTSVAISSPNLGVGVYVSGIQVDGTFLVDESDSELDVLFDVPMNGDQSDTGAGGEVSGNYMTFNPLSIPDLSVTLSNGNLDAAGAATNVAKTGTITVPFSGKWYWEITCNSGGSGVWLFGISGDSTSASVKRLLYTSDARKYTDTGGGFSSYGATFTTGDVIGVAVDMDSDTLTFYKNGSSQGTAFTSFSSGYTNIYPYFQTEFSGRAYSLNAGQRAFAYAAPSNHKALCTTNLPTPTVADGSAQFDAVLYTGDGNSTRSITGNLQPDFVWLKARSKAYSHTLFDAIRGAGSLKALYSNEVTSESGGNANATYGYVSSRS